MSAAPALKMRKHYKASAGTVDDKDARLLGKEFDRIQARHGKLTPQIILEEAKDPNSVLHSYFEWDDDKAAERYRISRARELMVSVRVVLEFPNAAPIETRAFVTVRDDRGRSYRNVEEVMSSKSLRDQVLTRALEDLRIWKERYKHLNELAEVFEVAERVVQKIKR